MISDDEDEINRLLTENVSDLYLSSVRAAALWSGMYGFEENRDLAQKVGLKAFGMIDEEADSPARSFAKGLLLWNGIGVARQREEGLRLTMAAAEAGSVPAMEDLVEIYAIDMLGAPDFVQVVAWGSAAARSGSLAAMTRIGARTSGLRRILW